MLNNMLLTGPGIISPTLDGMILDGGDNVDATNSGPKRCAREIPGLFPASLSHGLSLPRVQLCSPPSLYNYPLSKLQRAPHPAPQPSSNDGRYPFLCIHLCFSSFKFG